MDQIMTTMALVMGLVLVTSTLSGLVTEAIKKILDEKKYDYSKNILAGMVAAILGLLIGIGYVVLTKTPVTGDVIVYIIALILLSWLSAMEGFDKVKQTFEQLNGKRTDN